MLLCGQALLLEELLVQELLELIDLELVQLCGGRHPGWRAVGGPIRAPRSSVAAAARTARAGAGDEQQSGRRGPGRASPCAADPTGEREERLVFSRKFPPQTQSAQVWWRRTNIMLCVARQGARLMWWTAAPGGARDMRPFRLRWHGAEAAAQATLAFSGTARLRPPLMPRLRPCTQRGAGRRRPFASRRSAST
jgi:hypothetical protein